MTQGEIMTQGFQQVRAMFGGQGGPGGGSGGQANNRRGGGGGGAAATGTPPGGSTKGAPNPANGDPAATPGGNANGGAAPGGGGRGNRPDPNSPEFQAALAKMQESRTKMNDEAEKIDKQGEAKIAKVLTAKQRTNFNKMLGADVDLASLAPQRGGPGGPGGQPGANPPNGGGPQRGAAAAKAKTPAEDDGDR